eukprot:Opistho-2@35907
MSRIANIAVPTSCRSVRGSCESTRFRRTFHFLPRKSRQSEPSMVTWPLCTNAATRCMKLRCKHVTTKISCAKERPKEAPSRDTAQKHERSVLTCRDRPWSMTTAHASTNTEKSCPSNLPRSRLTFSPPGAPVSHSMFVLIPATACDSTNDGIKATMDSEQCHATLATPHPRAMSHAIRLTALNTRIYDRCHLWMSRDDCLGAFCWFADVWKRRYTLTGRTTACRVRNASWPAKALTVTREYRPKRFSIANSAKPATMRTKCAIASKTTADAKETARAVHAINASSDAPTRNVRMGITRKRRLSRPSAIEFSMSALLFARESTLSKLVGSTACCEYAAPPPSTPSSRRSGCDEKYSSVDGGSYVMETISRVSAPSIRHRRASSSTSSNIVFVWPFRMWSPWTHVHPTDPITSSDAEARHPSTLSSGVMLSSHEHIRVESMMPTTQMVSAPATPPVRSREEYAFSVISAANRAPINQPHSPCTLR